MNLSGGKVERIEGSNSRHMARIEVAGDGHGRAATAAMTRIARARGDERE
jgi:hypothetical protein